MSSIEYETLKIEQVSKTSFFKEFKRLLLNDSHLRNYVPLLAETKQYKKARLLKDQAYYDLDDITKEFWDFLPKRQAYDPTSRAFLFWYFLLFIIFVYYFVETGLVLTYGEVVWNGEITYFPCTLFNYFSIIIWIIDIYWMLNKGYFTEGILIMDRKRILSNYLKTEFVPNIIAILVVAICIGTQSYYLNYLKFFLVFKMPSIVRIDRIYQRVLQTYRQLKAVYLIARILTIILAMCHVIGLIFYAIDWHLMQLAWYQPSDYWLNASTAYNNIIGQTWQIQYMYSLYWGVNTLTNISYGDIAGYNPVEVIYMLICFIMAFLIYWYALSVIVGAILWAKEIQDSFRNELIVIDTYMRRKNIPQNLQVKIREYLQFLYTEESLRNYTIQNKMMSKLPQQMRQALMKDAYKMFYLKLIGTFGNFPNDFVEELIFQIIEYKYANNQILFSQGDIQHKLYLLNKGIIHLEVSYGGGQVERLVTVSTSHRLFGQYEFYTGEKRRYRAVSELSSVVYYIPRTALENFISNPVYSEHFRWLLDNVIFRQQYHLIGYVCHFCEKIHKFEDCDTKFMNVRKNFVLKSTKIVEPETFSPRKELKKSNVFALKRSSTKFEQNAFLKYQSKIRFEEMLKLKLQKRLLILQQQITLTKQKFQVDKHYNWQHYDPEWNYSEVERIINKGKK